MKTDQLKKRHGEGELHRKLKRAVQTKAEEENWFYRMEWRGCDLVLIHPQSMTFIAVEIETTSGNAIRNHLRNRSLPFRAHLVLSPTIVVVNRIKESFESIDESPPCIWLFKDFLGKPLTHHLRDSIR